MKELQAGIQLVQAKCIQLSQHPVLKKKASKPVAVKALPQQINDQKRPFLSFPIRSSLDVLRQRTTEGMRRLETQAEHINQLSAELEAAMLDLKAIASEINLDWRAIQATKKSSPRANVCEYRATAVPQVKVKPDGSFVLRSRPVDLFEAEREAALLAQTLRHRARKKREHRGGKP
jgi:hypothetical protein